MNKTELIDRIAAKADISKAAAGKALDAALEAVQEELVKGQPVTLIGFGTFDVAKRAERPGRNPSTGEAMTIKAAKTPRFKPGKALKEALN